MTASLTISELTSQDRPRERLAHHGSAALSDAELVAIVLGTGRSGENALTLAQSLLAQWRGPGGLARAEFDELCRRTGVGPAKAARLVATFALHARMSQPTGRDNLLEAANVAAIAGKAIGRARVEKALLLIGDSQHQLLRSQIVSQGDATGCYLSTRHILSLVLRHDGVSFALAHNHPSGAVEPSALDAAFTAQLQAAAYEVGVQFRHHVVVAGSDWSSITG